ncbi:MAG: hypothetical protein M0Z50_05810 [Planctomycetia bacterium]|nr:hypothetical protein [Planctomycetia bacterium]
MSARALTPEQAAARAADIRRIEGLQSALSEAVSDSYLGLDCRTASDRRAHLVDPQEQREADLLEHGSDDLTDPAYRDWCQPARLKNEFGTPFLGVQYLQEIHDAESEDSIEKAIHKAIYLTDSQEANSHDRPMMDVPKDGRRKGGTHGLAPEKRRRRSAKTVNESLMCKALIQIPGEEDVHELDCIEREEAEEFRHATNARLARKSAYVLYMYKGDYKEILALLLQSKETLEISKIVGLCDRRIRQIVNGVAQKGRIAQPGLRQIIDEIMANGVPASFQGTTPALVPVIVQPVKTLKKSLQSQAPMGQLGWDFDALMGVAA